MSSPTCIPSLSTLWVALQQTGRRLRRRRRRRRLHMAGCRSAMTSRIWRRHRRRADKKNSRTAACMWLTVGVSSPHADRLGFKSDCWIFCWPRSLSLSLSLSRRPAMQRQLRLFNTPDRKLRHRRQTSQRLLIHKFIVTNVYKPRSHTTYCLHLLQFSAFSWLWMAYSDLEQIIQHFTVSHTASVFSHNFCDVLFHKVVIISVFV